jgi:nucleoid-associated protein YgaU
LGLPIVQYLPQDLLQKNMPRRKVSKKTLGHKKVSQTKKTFWEKIYFAQSYTSLIFGAIVVLIIGILFISFTKVNNKTQTSSTKDFISADKLNLQNSDSDTGVNSNTSSTYTVKPGDDLWTISVNIYNDGYRWIEIAKANKLENPGLIFVGNKLIIPQINKDVKTSIEIKTTPKTTSNVVKNTSITGSSYTVVKGDNIWNIAVRAYGDGFRWPEIAKANNLVNPRVIHPGNHFIIPR